MNNISVIIVEYKNASLVRSALDSLCLLKAKFGLESIVVSNSMYPPGERQKIAAALQDAVLIFNGENVGFARANNQAMRRATGKYLLLINPDAKLSGTGILNTILFMEDNHQAGMTGPIIRDGEGAVQDSCRRFMTLRRVFERNVERLLGRSSGGSSEYSNCSGRRTVDWISGACMLVRRRAMEQVGMMDERYFMYIEDMDWCRRFWEAGWQVWYDPLWQVEHNASRTSTSAYSLTNRLMWIHLQSYVKYFLKWGGKPIRGNVVTES